MLPARAELPFLAVFPNLEVQDLSEQLVDKTLWKIIHEVLVKKLMYNEAVSLHPSHAASRIKLVC